MALGLMCQYLSQKSKKNGSIIYDNIIDEKSLQLGAWKAGKYSDDKILETYRNNIKTHIDFFPILVRERIKSFRISSSLFPLFEFVGNIAKEDKLIIDSLQTLGRLFKQNNIRVTCHPGQFTVLSSDKDSVVENSIKELQYHAWVFDMMQFAENNFYAINIHGGKSDRAQRLIDAIKSLPSNVKNRLTLENDERCYNVKNLVDIHKETGVPIVFDSHHHSFGDNDYDFEYSFRSCVDTWTTKPLQHISNTEPGLENASYSQRRSHSDYIHYVNPLQLDAIQKDLIDLDVEAKMKNFALHKMRKDFHIFS
jgi:UV DNA damage endonuclease